MNAFYQHHKDNVVRFCHVAIGDTFTTKQIHLAVAEALGCSVDAYKLSSLRYDLSKLRGKGLVQKLPRTRRYKLTPEGYRLCVVFSNCSKRSTRLSPPAC